MNRESEQTNDGTAEPTAVEQRAQIILSRLRAERRDLEDTDNYSTGYSFALDFIEDMGYEEIKDFLQRANDPDWKPENHLAWLDRR